MTSMIAIVIATAALQAMMAWKNAMARAEAKVRI
jgi:hypothetical protein